MKGCAIERTKSASLGYLVVAAAMVMMAAGMASAQMGPSPLFVATNSMTIPRGAASSTLLLNGKVLVAGGKGNSGVAVNAAEIYDPATGVFTAAGNMTGPRANHTATLLQNGQVLITGGVDSTGAPVNTAELFNPTTGLFTAVAATMSDSRTNHTASLLPNGQVLIAGGLDASSAILNTAEIYDAASSSFTCVGGVSATPPLCNSSMRTAVESHTATVLGNGTVLIAGGIGNSGLPVSSAELFFPGPGANPGSGSFGRTGSMTDGRADHTATLLSDGTVLIAGGFNGADVVATAEIYSPSTGRFRLTVNSNGLITVMSSPRELHSATLLNNGTVLLAGGLDDSGNVLATADIYDPSSGAFTAVASPMSVGRVSHTASLLNDGTVLVAGSLNAGLTAASTNLADLFDPGPGGFLPTGTMGTSRQYHTATLVSNGSTLITGGENALGVLAGTELYDGASFGAGPDMSAARAFHTATALTGEVLLAGGLSNTGGVRADADIYNVSGNSMKTPANAMSAPRLGHTATLLAIGKVLLAGGITLGSNVLNTADLFDPTVNAFAASHGKMKTARVFHTATLLLDGTVLITGGRSTGAGGILNNAEIYNPVKDVFTSVSGAMTDKREFHTATLLSTGQVLIAGGVDASGPVATAEIYDPVKKSFTAVGAMAAARFLHSAIRLPDGNVLLAGGESKGDLVLDQAEIFNPETAAFTPTAGLMLDARFGYPATLLQNGLVLLSGGADAGFNVTAFAELYDPPSGPSPAGAVILVPAGAESIGKRGKAVDSGRIEVVNVSGDVASFSGAAIAISSPKIFSKLVLTAEVGGPTPGQQEVAQVERPGATAVFTFNAPVVLPPGGSAVFNLSGLLRSRLRSAWRRVSTQTAIGMSVSRGSGSGAVRLQGLPASFGMVTVR